MVDSGLDGEFVSDLLFLEFGNDLLDTTFYLPVGSDPIIEKNQIPGIGAMYLISQLSVKLLSSREMSMIMQ